MLSEVHISNLITIEKLHLEFSSGTTIISGETGTGKSILIDAIELALGDRASEHLVRPGSDKTDISISFDIAKLPNAKNWLKEHDLEENENNCIIRRTINRDGRSRSYINSTPVTLQILRELSEFLINIHGQHEYQTLLKPEKHREILDCYANHFDLVKQTANLASEWREIQEKINTLEKSSEENDRHCQFLSFQLKELQALQLSANEFDELESEHKQLAHADELLKHSQHALTLLAENEEQNTIKLINSVLQSLAHIQHIDNKINT